MADTRDEGRTEQLWECPECGEFFHDSEQVGGFGEPAWDMPAECGPCGGIEMTLVGPMTTEEYRRRKKLVLRAPTSDTEDVGEEELETVMDIVDEIERAALGGRMLKVSRYEWAKKILARLRRTPETEALKEAYFLVDAACAELAGRKDHLMRSSDWFEKLRRLLALATQDPNAGGEDG